MSKDKKALGETNKVEFVRLVFEDGTYLQFKPKRQVEVDVTREVIELERMKDGEWKLTATKRLLEVI